MSIGTDDTPGPFPADSDYSEPQTDFDTADDVDNEEVDADDQDDSDQEESEGASEDAQRAPKAKSRRRAGPDRALIRRVAAKGAELAQADDDDVELLATLLGSGADRVDLTVAVMTAPRGATSALSDVRELAGSDGAERAVLAMTMGKPRMKALWSVLGHLDVMTGSLPASDAKAALALAEVDVGSEAMDRLDRVADLAKRA